MYHSTVWIMDGLNTATISVGKVQPFHKWHWMCRMKTEHQLETNSDWKENLPLRDLKH